MQIAFIPGQRVGILSLFGQHSANKNRPQRGLRNLIHPADDGGPKSAILTEQSLSCEAFLRFWHQLRH